MVQGMGVMSHNLCVPLGACPLSPLHVVEHVWQVFGTGVGSGAGADSAEDRCQVCRAGATPSEPA